MSSYLNMQISPFFLSTEIASFAAGPFQTLTQLTPAMFCDPGIGPSAAASDPSEPNEKPYVRFAALIDGRKLIGKGDGSENAEGGVPPPPGDAPSGGGSGDGRVGFNIIPTFNTVEHDRLYNMKTMASASQIKESMAIDLTSVGGDLSQLEYLANVMGTFDEFSRSGSRIPARDLVSVVNLAASAADDLTPMITPKTTGGFSGMDAVSLLMRRITSVADNLERDTIVFEAMDRATAGVLAGIFFIAAVKGSCADALRERLSSGINNPIYKAYVSKALMQLTDVMHRFERLGRSESVALVRKVVTQFNVYHGLPTGSRKWAFDTAVDFLCQGVRHMYAGIEIDPSIRGATREARLKVERSERHAALMHNLWFFIHGNRQHSAAILFNVQKSFAEQGDEVMSKRFNEWAVREMRLSDTISRI